MKKKDKAILRKRIIKVFGSKFLSLSGWSARE
jgi:hypothetical protein